MSLREIKRRVTTRLYRYLKTRPRVRGPVLRAVRRVSRAMAPLGTTLAVGEDPVAYGSTPDWVQEWAGGPERAILHRLGHAEPIRNPPPRNIHGQVDEERRRVENVVSPAPFVAEVPLGRAVGEHGAVVTPDNKVLQDVSWPDWAINSYQSGSVIPVRDEFIIDARLPARRIKGTVAVLSSYAGRGYFHWIFDVLPRLGLLQQAGFEISDIDYFLVPTRASGFHFETLDRLGIPESRLISSFQYRHVMADRLLVPSATRPEWVTPTWVIDYLRKSFPPAKPADGVQSARLYVMRKATDHGILGNEEGLFTRLQAFGFERVSMERYTLGQKAWLLGQAEAIIGPSGAGLSNIVFCMPGTKVIELRVQPFPVMEAWDIGNRRGVDFYDVLPDGYGRGERSLLTQGMISEKAVLATLELAGLPTRASK